MPEQPSQPPSTTVFANLHALANILREALPLKPEEQRALGELIDELGKAIDDPSHTSQEWDRLAEDTAHLLTALHECQDPRLPASARQRLEEALIDAEARAPLLVGLVRRWLEALAGTGI